MNTDTVIALYQHGSLICAAIVAVYLLLRWGVGHVPWLEQPQHALYATIAVTALGVFAVPAAAGVAPSLNMALAALGTLAALVLPGLTAVPKAPTSGKVNLTLLSLLALAAVIGLGMTTSCSWWTASGKPAATTAGKVAAACAVSDLETYGSDLAQRLTGGDYEAQLAAFAKAHNFGQDAMNCLVGGLLAGVESLAEQHGQPSPIVINGHAYLAAHGGKIAAVLAPADVKLAAARLGARLGCEPSTVTPAVDCRPYESEHYDGCHWTCEAR